jgi:predicted metal-dependent HD superfamily phosphohydrolase
MREETELVINTRQYVEALMSNCQAGKLPFHNLSHTREVVKAARKIGKKSGLSPKDLETVEVAAWLHDIGHCSGPAVGHEERGAQVAHEFLATQQVGEHRIEKVVNCILATRMPQQPDSLLAQVLCDADLYHLSTEDCLEKGELIREEMAQQGHSLCEEEWLKKNASFLRDHHYFTEYGQDVLQPRQNSKFRELEEKLLNKEKKSKWEKKVEKLEAQLAEEKLSKPGRGVETMFRTTSTNHLQLSAMADTKANIMISINSIIVSLMVSVLIRKFDEFPNLILPTAILTTVCLVTIVFAVLATRPNVSTGRFNREDIALKKTNLLFFGNFHQMSLEDYEWGMRQTMKDSDLLYASMIKDIYFLGKVLGKKYQLLRISYTVFMFGFVLAVVSYALAMILYPTPS